MGREYQYVKSNNVQGVAYDKDSQTLYVQFTSGAEYAYSDVPEDKYDALRHAPSVGSYLNDFIKEAYSYERL